MNTTLATLAVLDGISYAALVFLVSVGLSLIFGVLRVVNVVSVLHMLEVLVVLGSLCGDRLRVFCAALGRRHLVGLRCGGGLVVHLSVSLLRGKFWPHIHATPGILGAPTLIPELTCRLWQCAP